MLRPTFITAVLCLSTLLSACASPERNFYEGLQRDSARRQFEPGRELNPAPPPPSFEDYQKERQRLEEGSVQ